MNPLTWVQAFLVLFRVMVVITPLLYVHPLANICVQRVIHGEVLVATLITDASDAQQMLPCFVAFVFSVELLVAALKAKDARTLIKRMASPTRDGKLVVTIRCVRIVTLRVVPTWLCFLCA